MIALQEELVATQAAVQLLRTSSASARALHQSLVAAREDWAVFRRLAGTAADLFLEATDVSKLISTSASDAAALAREVPTVLQLLRTLRSRGLELLNTRLRDTEGGAVDRARSEEVSYSAALQGRSVRVEEEAQREKVLKALAEAAVQARVEVTEQRFRAVQPLVADIFSRLDPHPSFKTIEFELDTYYRRGTTSPMVRDVLEDVSADPLLVFSTSQANIAALSYFLAMGWSAGKRGLPFVMLDDPVQSMDDVNVLGFADLCRHVRRERQIFVSTHERRFTRLLERKLAPRGTDESTTIMDFRGWDRSGPDIEERQEAPDAQGETIRVVRTAS
jgi:hypothetical protein